MTGAYQNWQYAPAGYEEPLEGYVNNKSKTASDYDYDDFYPGLVKSLTWDCVPGHPLGKGHLWSLPMGWELNNLSYNKPALEKAGVAVPKTTDDLLKAATKLQGFNGKNSYGIAVRGTRNWATIHPGYMSLFATWGGKDFKIKGGKLKSQLDSKEAIEMTDYWVKLIKAGGSKQWSQYTWYQCGADLGAGKAAMMFDATSNAYFQNFKGASKESGNIAWTTIPLPEGKTEADMKANLWVWSLAINKTSKNKDAAWLFVQYFTNKKFMQWSGTDGSCVDTPRQSVFNSDAYKKIVGTNVGYMDAFNKLSKGAAVQFTPQPMFNETTTEWAAVLQDLVTSKKYSSTEQAMKKLAQKEDDIVKDLDAE